MVKNVACFFTGAHTESNEMINFLRKINGDLNFKQLCPNKTKRRKVRGGIESVTNRNLIECVSGLTGSALIRYVYNYLDTYRDECTNFDALIIEDDLDGHFFEIGTDGQKKSSKTKEFSEHCKLIKNQIVQKLGKNDDFPVIFLYAAPEVETWLLSDWNNSFGYVYGPKKLQCLTTEENRYFSARFQPYVNEHVLMEYCSCIENYGYFNNEYCKLSDKLIASLREFKVFISEYSTEIPQLIAQNQALRYSKKDHGDAMLQNLSPEKVKDKCPLYFAEAFDAIKNL